MSLRQTIPRLCDALARGRLSLAEIVGLEVEELDAIHAAACDRLAAGFARESIEMLGGLVALFPFDARYWAAFAAALERGGELAQALAAAEAALLLEPRHAAALVLREQISGRLSPRVTSEPEPVSADPFLLVNLEPLPLADSTFDEPRQHDEVTQTARVFAPTAPSREITDTAVLPGRVGRGQRLEEASVERREITNTAIVRRLRGVRLTGDSDE